MKKMLGYLKRHWAGVVVVGLILFVLVGGFGLWALTKGPRPQDLGSQLVYVAQRDFGCQIPRLTVYCDGDPSTEYYFATDLDKESLRKYFKTKNNQPANESHGGGGDGFEFDDFTYDTDRGQIVLSFYEYDDPTAIERMYNTNKKYIIEISSADYEIAKSAL